MKCEICGSDYPSKYHFDVEWICTSCFEDLAPDRRSEITATRNSLRENREREFKRSQEREPKTIVGCGLILVAVIFFGAALISSLALQSIFFTMEDYLEEPMWTSHVPTLLNAPSGVVGIVAAVAAAIAPWLAGALGLYFLITGEGPYVVPRIGVLVVLVPLVALMLHCLLLSLGYVLVRGGMPPNSGELFMMIVVSLGVSGLLLGLLWWKIQKEWPWEDRPEIGDEAA